MKIKPFYELIVYNQKFLQIFPNLHFIYQLEEILIEDMLFPKKTFKRDEKNIFIQILNFQSENINFLK